MIARIAVATLLMIGSLSLSTGCETVVGSTFDSLTGRFDTPGSQLTAPGKQVEETESLAEAIADPGAPGRISVLSFNTLHRDVPLQMELVAEQLQRDFERLPDFVLCQEVVFDRPAKMQDSDTGAALARLLGYESRGTDRKGGSEGLSILSRYPFEHYEYLQLDARSSFTSLGFPRVSVMGEFDVPEVGRVRVVNVHLAYRRTRHKIRRLQLQETLDWMAERQRLVHADVVVLGGDFNTEPGWDELTLVHDRLACGGHAFLDFNTRYPSMGSKPGEPTRRLDYIFICAPDSHVASLGESLMWSNGISTRDGKMFHPSDHLPLLHVFDVASDATALVERDKPIDETQMGQ